MFTWIFSEASSLASTFVNMTTAALLILYTPKPERGVLAAIDATLIILPDLFSIIDVLHALANSKYPLTLT